MMPARKKRLGGRNVHRGNLVPAGLVATGALVLAGVADARPAPPSLAFPALFPAVQLTPLYPDQKTFCDLVPKAPPFVINYAYAVAHTQPGFSLAGFVNLAFAPGPAGPTIPLASAGEPIRSYIDQLWTTLTDEAPAGSPFASLLTLPKPYVVPGGRFNELYYWDTFFDLVGLEQSGRGPLSDGIIDDFAYEIRTYGHIPNGNRSYYLSRSQPPFFATMLALVAKRRGTDVFRQYLPELRIEYDYWMRGADGLAAGAAAHNVVRLWDGTLLNRYWDERDAPRDESYADDVATAAGSGRVATTVYRDLRAAAESGWDFSSRWLADGKTLSTIRTTEIVPPDLNSLLYALEAALSVGERLAGDQAASARYATAAASRKAAIQRLMWDDNAGAFADILRTTGKSTGVYSAATVYPLVFGIATPTQAHKVAISLRQRLLQVGGVATTTLTSGQQWDFPNGWAPVQWLATEGFRNYGENDLAYTIASRWTANVHAGYDSLGKLVEKYDVTRTDGGAGAGGEYATQIGFGWTNGVQLGLYADYPGLEAAQQTQAPVSDVSLTMPSE